MAADLLTTGSDKDMTTNRMKANLRRYIFASANCAGIKKQLGYTIHGAIKKQLQFLIQKLCTSSNESNHPGMLLNMYITKGINKLELTTGQENNLC